MKKHIVACFLPAIVILWVQLWAARVRMYFNVSVYCVYITSETDTGSYRWEKKMKPNIFFSNFLGCDIDQTEVVMWLNISWQPPPLAKTHHHTHTHKRERDEAWRNKRSDMREVTTGHTEIEVRKKKLTWFPVISRFYLHTGGWHWTFCEAAVIPERRKSNQDGDYSEIIWHISKHRALSVMRLTLWKVTEILF